MTVAFVSPFPDGSLAPRWALLSVAVPIVLLVRGWPCFTLGHWLFAGFLVLGGLSLLWTPSIYDGLDIYWHFLLFGGLLCIAPSNLRPVYLGAGCALALNSIVVLFQVLGFDPVNQTFGPAGLFFNKNFGAEAAVLVIIGLSCARRPRWGMLLAGASSVPLFVFPLSRGAWLALAVAGLIVLWKRNRFAAVLVGILLAGLTVRLSFDLARTPSVDLRLELWVNVLETISPFGLGLGSFRWNYPWYEYAHNDLLQIAFELGLPGVLVFGGFLVSCLRRGAATERLVLVAFLVEGLFGFPLYNPVTMALAALATGSLLCDRVPVREPVALGEFGRHVGRYGARYRTF